MGPGSEAGTTMRYAFAFSRHDAPEVFKLAPPLKPKGACDPQERAQGRPGARCTRGLVCIDAQKNAHTSIQVKRKHSGLPCAMALQLIRALPGDRAFLPPLPARSVGLLRT